MKIKGIIKKLKNLKSINNKNMSWNFSGAVVGSVGSVQFQIVPCPSSYLFSMSVGPLQCLVSANYRALICHSCHFQSGSASLFWLPLFAGLFSVSSVSHFPRGEGGRRWSLIQAHLFSCVVGREGPCNKRRWRVWGALAA